MKKILLLSLLCAGAGVMCAQTKIMRIHHSNGSTQTFQVTDVDKITFEDLNGDNPGNPGTPDNPPTIDPTTQMVDMGLSVKWAAWNIGASSPDQYGNYFAYGEVKPKSDYTFDNYEWIYYGYFDGEDLDEWEYYLKLGANFSGTNYDAAHVNWGDKWRMPSRAEWRELYNNSTKTWTSVNGVEGAMFTSNINGNSIFLPAAGNKFDGKETHQGTNCMYWTPEEYDYFDNSGWNNECRNYRVDISATYQNTDGYEYPEVGFPIRAVYGDLPEEVLPTVKVPAASEAVDLGLPSGTKWAPYNLGASSSNGTGLFLCFGEMNQKYYSHTYNYKYYDPLTDKCKDFGGDIQGTEYDSAHIIWGGDWVMPTKDQLEELITWGDWVATGYGFNIIGPNGNSIYLPACGQMTYMGAPRSSTESLYYMSSTEAESETNSSHYGVLASRGYGNSLDAPQIKSWFSKVGAKQIRPVINNK